MTENEIGKVVVDSAIAVHHALGSGLYEIVYEVVLAHELKKHGIKFDEGFKADIIVESKVILELKSVESVTKAHKKQVLTYLRLTGCPPGNAVRTGKLGYLLNFSEGLMKDGISRIINGELE